MKTFILHKSYHDYVLKNHALTSGMIARYAVCRGFVIDVLGIAPKKIKVTVSTSWIKGGFTIVRDPDKWELRIRLNRKWSWVRDYYGLVDNVMDREGTDLRRTTKIGYAEAGDRQLYVKIEEAK